MAYGFTYTLPTIPGSHSNFPVGLFHTPSGRQDFPSAAIDGGASSILNGGGNLRAYTSSAKTTRLPVDVVSFVAGGTPAAEVWIKIPTAATGNTIYIEADDTETTQPAVTNAYGRNAVWSDYEAVYHLEEAANTDSGGYLDSTGNGNDGTGNSTWLSDTPGQIGNAAQNDGGSNYIDCPTTAVSTIKRLSSWMQFDSLSGNRTFGSHDGTNRLYLGTTGSNLFVGYGSGYTNSVSGGFGTGTPVKLSLAVDGSTVRVRVNGVEKTTFSASASGASTKNLYLLGRNYTDLIDKIDGWQDEVLLDTVYRSADWEATEYANQSASGAWGTVGTWADSGGGVSAAVGLVTETASPLSASAAKTKSVGLPAESANAISVSASKLLLVGLPAEAASPFAVAAAKSKAAGLASESSTGFSVSAAKARPAGLVIETASALPVAPDKTKSVGMVAESTTSLSVIAAKAKSVGLPSVASTALALRPLSASATVGLVTETSAPLAVSARKSKSVGLATVTSSPLSATPGKSIRVGLTVETGSSFAVSTMKAWTVGLPSEASAALGLQGDQEQQASYVTLSGEILMPGLTASIEYPPLAGAIQYPKLTGAIQ